MISFIKKYYLALLWAMISLAACGVNGQSLPKVSFNLIGIDKLAHFILFGVQSFLIIYAHQRGRKDIDWPHVHLAVFMGIAYGILIEFLQYAVFVNRSYDYADMAADALGAVSCYAFTALFYRN
ncbi:MAG: VanZ family protein [Bacteroidota bacterium]|nr:VanZ family protein [Bacteroidota bacterium]